jgi:hypothetical protein
MGQWIHDHDDISMDSHMTATDNKCFVTFQHILV